MTGRIGEVERGRHVKEQGCKDSPFYALSEDNE